MGRGNGLGREMSHLVQVGRSDLSLSQFKRGAWKSITLNGSIFCEDELAELLAHPCCAGLTHLYLSETELDKVPQAVQELYELRVLVMSGNYIESVPSQLASQLVRLERLDLSRNCITEADRFLASYEALGCTFSVDLSYNFLCGVPDVPGVHAAQNPVQEDCALLLPPGSPYPFPTDANGSVEEQVYAEYRRLFARGDAQALLVAFRQEARVDPKRPGYFGDLVLVPIIDRGDIESVARNLIARGCVAHSALLLPDEGSSEEEWGASF